MANSDLQNDPAAERAVIAGVFTFGSDIYLDVQDLVQDSTFTINSNKVVWRCIEHIFKQEPEAKIDYPSIMSAAKTLGLQSELDSNQEKTHLRSLMDMPIKQQTVRRMAARIRRLEVIRLLDGQLNLAKQNIRGLTGDESFGTIMSMAEGPIFDFTSLLTDNESSDIRMMGDGAVEYLKYLAANPREMIGISTGLPIYDKAIGGGVRPNSLNVIAARPKSGKSFLVDNMGLSISEREIPVFNIDTEMDWQDHLHRVAAAMSGVDIDLIECGKFKASEREVLTAGYRLQSLPFAYASVLDKTFEEIMALLRRWVTRYVGLDENGYAKPCVVLYDYLKMLSDDFTKHSLSEYQALGFITTTLKNFMGRYRVGSIAFSQLNRQGIDVEDSSVISGSDRISHYATSLSLYKRKTPDERVEAGDRGKKYTHKLIPLFGRHGAGIKDGDYINIEAQYHIGRVIEGPTHYDLQHGHGDKQERHNGFVLTDGDVDAQLDL